MFKVDAAVSIPIRLDSLQCDDGSLFHSHSHPSYLISSVMARFHRRVWVGLVYKGAAQFAFPPQKWAGFGLSCTRLAILHWGTETFTSLTIPCDRRIIKNKHSAHKVFGQRALLVV